MTKLFPDTDPQIERVWLEMLRQAPAWRKLHIVAEMNRAGRELALLGLRKRYPTSLPSACAVAWRPSCWGKNWLPALMARYPLWREKMLPELFALADLLMRALSQD